MTTQSHCRTLRWKLKGVNILDFGWINANYGTASLTFSTQFSCTRGSRGQRQKYPVIRKYTAHVHIIKGSHTYILTPCLMYTYIRWISSSIFNNLCKKRPLVQLEKKGCFVDYYPKTTKTHTHKGRQ